MNNPEWRPATVADLATIDRIGNVTHVAFQERAEVFAEKYERFREGCFVLVQKGAVVGYCVSHPWRLYSVPPLDTFLGPLPAHPECLFIHDVVVLPQARHGGALGALIEIIATVARQRDIDLLALVSVYNTHPLWARHGFQIVSDPSLSEKLKSYGNLAKYMVRRLVLRKDRNDLDRSRPNKTL